jgi:hypothetical protein
MAELHGHCISSNTSTVTSELKVLEFILDGILRSCLSNIQLAVISAFYVPDVNVLMTDVF